MTTILVAQQKPGAKPKKDPCDDEAAAAKMSQQEMNQCAFKDFEKADAELNAVYKKLMSLIDDEAHKGKIKTAQLAWIKFRDAHCEAEAFPNEGGSIYPLVEYGCKAGLTRKRVKELKELVDEFGNR
ncbi:MAG: DUF1311 domain-containing protein [Blastocatellia bacterium]|nr:DUF1311 domain-containing protein [Blastocatellia bacterium]